MDFQSLRKRCISETKSKIRQSVNYDNLIIQAVSSNEDLEKIINMVVTRLREWYSLYNPEFPRSIQSDAKFVELILRKDKCSLLKETNTLQTMGADLRKIDIDAILYLTKQAENLIALQDQQKDYIESILRQHCPNTLEVLGASLTAKFIHHAGSLRRLAITTAPVVQIMGAEQSLFKHMKKKGKCPKYGILYAHPLINRVKKQNRGKMARAIADKASLAMKLDFFKGSFQGKKLKTILNQKASVL
jgi:nucleolar protein 56